MSFLYINATEINALLELPYIQRIVYLMGVRPYMDRETCIVGIKRKISYQSLREILYIGPIAGVKTGCPSLQQVKRAVKSLERAGLVEIQSTTKHLILKCALAESDESGQNQAVLRANHELNPKQNYKNSVKSAGYKDTCKQANPSETAQADPPHISENYYVCLGAQFKKFWSLYPAKNGKQKTWEAFQAIAPSTDLFTRILTALENQLKATKTLQSQGLWTPKWKFPANWLMQQCWNDEIDTSTLEEKQHASHSNHPAKNNPSTFSGNPANQKLLMPRSLLMNNAIESQMMSAVNDLFSKFAVIYGNSWRNQFKTGEFLEFAKNQWLQALSCFDETLVNQAIVLCREQQKFPPSIPEFVSYCKQLQRKNNFAKPEKVQPASRKVAEYHLKKMKTILNMNTQQREQK